MISPICFFLRNPMLFRGRCCSILQIQTLFYRLLTTTMTATLSLTGSCVSTKDSVKLRQKSYEKLAAMIQPGMTRRQLYALLPPKTIPRANPPYKSFAQIYYPHSEDHWLDPDFKLLVTYKLANPREWPMYKNDMKQRAEKVMSIVMAMKHRSPEKNRRGYIIIDVPSRQNMDDVVLRSPLVDPPQGRKSYTTYPVKFEDITVKQTEDSNEASHQRLRMLRPELSRSSMLPGNHP